MALRAKPEEKILLNTKRILVKFENDGDGNYFPIANLPQDVDNFDSGDLVGIFEPVNFQRVSKKTELV